MKKSLFPSLQICFYILCYLYASSNITRAQVTTDDTVNTVVDQDGNVSKITGGETRGSNLFHSFKDFSVQTGREAFFDNASDISNIFSRVTGGNISNIDGAIRANGSASLFLINPAGIIFGENARLDIGGSFYGSTASSILFEDGEFSTADLDNPPLLTVNAPIGLGFRDEPGAINNNSVANNGRGLEVNPGNNLSLLGGNINFNGGRVTVPGGIVTLSGLSAAGEINFDADNNLSFNDEIAKSNVFLSNNGLVDISGNGGGSIAVNANNLELTGASLFLAGIGTGNGSQNAVAGTIAINTEVLDFDNNSAIVTSSFGEGDAGTIDIDAQSISFDGEWGGVYSTLGLSRIATDEAISDAVGNGGEINLNTSTLSLTNGARISSNSVAQGNAGNININATDKVFFSGSGETFVPAFGGTVLSGLSSQVQFAGNGNGGQINLEAGSLELDTGSGILADNDAVKGDAGDIKIDVKDNLSISGFFSLIQTRANNDEGDAGAINIIANSIESNNLKILADNEGVGNSGDIIIDVAETISIDEGSIIQTGVKESGVGDAGDITINANSFFANNSSDILARTEGQGNAGKISITTNELISLNNQSKISSRVATGATGNGGNISLVGGQLNLSNQSKIIANTDGQSLNQNDLSTAGDIEIDIAGDIILDNDLENISFDNGNQIQSQVEEGAVGNAGNITINTGGSLFSFNSNQILNGSQGNGNGGNIQIIARDSIEMRDESLVFSNTSEQGIGDTGSIFISANNTFVLDESQVLSQILDEARGNPGGIDIIANTIDINNFSHISTNAQIGSSGTAGNINLNGSSISISSGAIVDSLTENNFDGGNININGDNLEIVSGGVVVTSAEGTGNAGSVNIEIIGDITIDGENTPSRPENIFLLAEQSLIDLQEETGIFSTSSVVSTGSGGNIKITKARDFTVSNNSTISVDSQGGGNGGIISINTNSLNLDDQVVISAITASGNGGNINLVIDKQLRLNNSSLISAQALESGNGGNINLDTDFIIAFPNGDNDIIANAQEGTGGNININAQSLFGIQERRDQAKNSNNDIDASSQFSLDGKVIINTVNLNPLQEATELPSNIVNPEQIVAQGCKVNRELTAQNSLTLKGKGGISDNPTLLLNSRNISIDGETNSTSTIAEPIETSQGKIQPARGINRNEFGELILTAYRTNNSGSRFPKIKRNCGSV